MIILDKVSKSFDTPAGRFDALRSVSLTLAAGSTAVVGPSGSGKSTLLHLLAGMDRPSSGAVTVAGTNLGAMTANDLARWRGRTVGIVFQFFQLMPTLTVAENVMLPMDFLGALPDRARRERAAELLERVGVSAHADKCPGELSGGQQQRVAIARALANDPPIVLADEPTGNLDSATGSEVMALFRELREAGKTVVVVTHDRQAAGAFDRVVSLVDGGIA